MSETSDLLSDMATRLFSDACGKDVRAQAEAGVFPAALWSEIEAAGLSRAVLSEADGGSNLGWADAMIAVRIAAHYAAPVPLAETLMATFLLSGTNIICPKGPLSIAPISPANDLRLEKKADRWRLIGKAQRIPFARNAEGLAILAHYGDQTMAAIVNATQYSICPGENLAREPRDSITLDCEIASANVAPAAAGRNAKTLRLLGAALRCQQMAGALSAVLALSLDYAQTRVQFGKAISKFQAVQHALAMLGAHSAAANAAADMAAEGADRNLDFLSIAAAKTRCGEAASAGAAIAHQAHGAIGFTQEYALHYLTKRLWSWRDEFGDEADWSLAIGRAAAQTGPARLWSDIIAA